MGVTLWHRAAARTRRRAIVRERRRRQSLCGGMRGHARQRPASCFLDVPPSRRPCEQRKHRRHDVEQVQYLERCVDALSRAVLETRRDGVRCGWMGRGIDGDSHSESHDGDIENAVAWCAVARREPASSGKCARKVCVPGHLLTCVRSALAERWRGPLIILPEAFSPVRTKMGPRGGYGLCNPDQKGLQRPVWFGQTAEGYHTRGCIRAQDASSRASCITIVYSRSDGEWFIL
ncbi:hypothetical protein FKP32DRAFT_885144 [Trametes sanguinea]|nr:hypothetical protein FKP32DRAFT_885144 [Trametes sanguinea]